MKKLLLLASVLLAFSCKQGSNETSKLVIVDVAKDYPEKEIYLQDIADIEYILLPTTDSILVNAYSRVSEEGMVARGGKVGEILLFDNKGKKLQGRICQRGQGPEEYNAVIYNIVDWKRKEVFIADYTTLKVFDFTGKYLRTLLKTDIMKLNICNLDDSHLLCSYSIANSETPYRPYFTLSKETGQADTLSVEIPRFIASNRKVIMDDGSVSNAYGYLPQITACSDRVWLTDLALDTVFILHPGQRLEPIMVPLLAPTQNPEAPLLYFLGMNDYYAWISRLARNVTVTMADMSANREKRERAYLYNRITQEWVAPVYRNRDFSSRDWDPTYINTMSVPNGYGLIQLSAMDLVEAYQKKQIVNEKLKQIASQLQEEDNPVLMMLKFKPHTGK